MRPDTQPNRHAKRIMAGALVLTCGLLVVHAGVWVAAHYPTVALAACILSAATVACYVVGMIGLSMADGL